MLIFGSIVVILLYFFQYIALQTSYFVFWDALSCLQIIKWRKFSDSDFLIFEYNIFYNIIFMNALSVHPF